ncbi:MAG: succinyl transferase OpgC, partial [Alteromonadales bacterium]|nr:succinyl transferase OpgC [Alteromonadales bacterium]
MNRISALDGIRGLLLILMTINHLIWMSGGQTSLQLFTLQPFGQFGAAEGFILISGLLAGIVYSSEKYSYPQLKEKAFARAFEIYKYHAISLVVVIGIVVAYIHLIPATEPLWRMNMPNLINDSVNAYFLSLLLINRPTYFDILPLYFVMMLCLPFIIMQLHKGRLWLVASISICLWLLSGVIEQQMLTKPLTALTPSLTVNLGYFDLFAWQLLFTAGVVLGYFQRVKPINWFPSKTLVAIAALLVIVLFCMHQGLINIDGFHLFLFADKANLGWLRLLNLGLFIYLLAFVIK